MKNRKILTLIMVMVFLISFIGAPANASTTYVHHDCLEHGMPNYPGIHDVYVHYEDAILSSGGYQYKLD